MAKKWMKSDRRRLQNGNRRRLFRLAYRPTLEGLETRLAPANVNITAFHYDPFIQGQDTQETNLSPLTVNANNFGKLASIAVDGYTYSQPLYLHGLMIGGQAHDVAFVATEHDSLYAFDVTKNATTGAVTLTQLWQRSFINPSAGITSVPQPDVISGDIVPEIGITGAPVIDPATNVLYLVAKTKEVRADGTHYVQKLYAIDLTSPTGADKTAPYTIGDTHGSATFANETTAIMVPGQGAETSGGANPMVPFSALKENQRPSLQLLNGRVYVAWASHGDNGPYHGWVVGFNETTLQPEKIFCTSPNGGLSGIWQSEGALSVSDGRYLYFAVGNGGGAAGFQAFDPAHGNYSESVIKLDTQAAGTMMPVTDYFTPFNWQALDNADADLGSGGVMLLPDSVGSTAHQQLMVETGKDGHIYLLDRNNMGRFTSGGPNMIVQDVVAGPGGVWGNPSYYQESANSGLIFYHGSGSDSRVFRVSNGQIQSVSGNFIAYRSNQTFGFPGANPVISANGVNNPSSAVVWEVQTDNYGSQGPATLHAYSLPSTATGTLTELYNSNQAGARDQLSASVKFTGAVTTNGLVFVAQGGRPAAGNPASGTFNVFGLFPPPTMPPAAPTNLTAQGLSSTQIQLNWTNPPPNQGAQATANNIFRSVGDNMHYGTTPIATVAGNATTYTDTVSDPNQVYFYKVQASNVVGNSAFSNEVSATPFVQPVLSVVNVASNAVALSWTRPPVANNRFDVERSRTPDFASFTTVAAGLSTNTTSYTDTSTALTTSPGTYYYRIRAYSTSGSTPFALSNVVGVKVGPNAGVINYGPPNGFPTPPAPAPFDLQANGSAQFAESTARLTNANNQAGSVFSAGQENILNWTTTFNVRLHEGTQPNYANGFTFTIQALGPNALGQGQAGLGYQGITNSVTIKFETTTGAAENGTGGSTGLFYAGDVPTTPNPNHPGEVNLPLTATTVNLMSQSTKSITLSYAYNAANPSASVLREVITDNGPGQGTFTHDYTVDIPSLLGIATSGNAIGYVGFTASTGSQGYWELQDILNWVYTPTGPAAPNHLTVVSGTTTNMLSWRTTSADDQGYYVERSTNINGPYTRIATLPAGTTTYTDTVTGNPQQYYYRVQQFNHNGAGGAELDSGYSNVATGAVVSVNFASFPNGNGFTANTGTPAVREFPGTPPVLRLTDGQNGEATSVWYNTVIGSGAFTTTFTLHDVPNAGAADSVSFVIQNDPRGTAALGGGGGAGGYSGITNSIAIKFDLYTHGSHNSSTGLFTNGQSPDGFPAQDVIMGPSPIDLRTGHPMQVTLVYDGGTRIDQTVRDTVSGAVFTHTYTLPMTLAQMLGGNVGYVGFTGATGGENATQEIQSWTGQFAQAPPQITRFAVSANPTSITAGQSVSVTVTAMDQNGNVFAGYTGTVHFSSNDGQAQLPANYTFTAADMGMHVFTGVVLKTAGNETITVTDTAKPNATGTTTVTVSPAATAALSVSGFPAFVSRGVPGNFTVTAKDQYGNTTPAYRGTVHFTSSDPAAVLPANYTFTASDNGTHNFTATLNTVGVQSITATDTTTMTITGTQSGINVQQTGTVTVDFSNGFANHGNLTANGSASFPNGTTVARLTDAQNGEAASLFYNTLVGTGPFSTTFTFQMRAGSNPIADGLTFVIQADPRGVTALGQGGGALGYGTDANDGQPPAIQNSIAIKFDAYKNFPQGADGNHSSTGLYVSGHRPNNPPGSLPGDQPVDLAGSGIDFNGSAQLTNPHTFTVTLSYDGATLTETIRDNSTMATFSHSYTVNIAQVVGSSSAYVGFTAGTGGLNAFIDLVSWAGSFQQAGLVNVNFANGFANHTTLTANTLPQSPPVNVFPANPPVLQLTDNRAGEATSVFYNTPIGVGPFSTTFTLQDQPNGNPADSLSFVIQADPRGLTALGGSGGAGGYGGITNSIAVKFDLWNHGNHSPYSTGLFTGGQAPDSDPSKDVPLTPIDLNSGHPLQVTFVYDGTTLTEMIRDTVTNQTFSHSYTLNLAQVIGGNSAYVGFTAGTGGASATQTIVNWTGVFSAAQATRLVVSAPATVPAGTPFQVTVTAVDQNGNPLPGYRGTIHFTSSDPAAVLPANYSFAVADNGARTFTVTLNTIGNQTITATDTAVASITGTRTVNVTFDFSLGFANPSNLQANGSATFVGPVANPVGMFTGHQDIGTAGNPAPAGNATFNGGTGAYTLTASGSDIWDTADHFHYLYEPLVGDGQIIARLVSATAPDFWTKAGLMIRADLSAGAANVIMLDTPNTGHQEPVMQWRDLPGNGSGDTGNHGTSTTPNVPVPIWLRLVRVGNTFYGYWATDNNGSPNTWQLLGNDPHNTTMPSTVYVGLALTAHNNGAVATATFDHVQVIGTTVAPAAPVVARLTDGGNSEAGSIFSKTKLPVGSFTTTFLLKDQPVNAGGADSLSFVLQNDPRGPAALGAGGGAGGYQGIQNSIAVKFDLWTNGTHAPMTGLFVNGQSPASDNTQDVAVTGGLSFLSGDPIQVTLTYNGTTLTESLRDTVTGQTFTYDWVVNLTQILGGGTAYAGFTAGTGGASAIQDVQSWTYQPIPVPAAASLSVTVTRTPNLVTNGDFETGNFNGWTLTGFGAGDASIVTGTAGSAEIHGGTHAGQFGPSGGVGLLTQTLATTPGVTYSLDFWLSNPIGGTGTEWLVRVGGATLMDVTDAPRFNFTHFTFTFTATGSSTDLQFGFKHVPDWFYLDDVSVTPASAVAGGPVQLTVTALDAGGHRVAYTGTVHFTSTDPQASLPANYTFTAADNGQHTFAVTLRTAGSQAVFATDTANNQLMAVATVGVSPAAAAGLTVSGFPSPVTAGVPGMILVTAKDAYGNAATGYRGTVHFTSSDPQAGLPADYTFTAADMGAHAFSVTLKTAGTQSITATDTANPGISGTQSGIVVNPAATAAFRVQAPATITAGQSFIIQIAAVDPFGNVTPGYTGTVHFSSSDPQAALPDDYTFTAADQGRASFIATLFTAGSQIVTVADQNGLTGTTTVQVTPAAASALVVSGFPSPVTAGDSGTFTVTVVDAYGNTVTGYTGTVTFSSSDPQAQLPDDYTFTAADAGVHSFTATLFTAGSQTLAAQDVNNPGIAGEQDGIAVTPAAFSQLVVSGFPSPTTAGVPGTFTVTAEDAYGNTITDYAGTLAFFSSDAQADVPDNYTFTPDDQGTHTFTATLFTAGTQVLGAIDINDPRHIVGEQKGIQVVAAEASVLVVRGFPSPITAGTPGTFTVTAMDPYGNVATGYTGTISFYSSDPQAQLPADYTFTPDDGGVHVFTATLNTPGTQGLGAYDVDTGILGQQDNIEVDPAGAPQSHAGGKVAFHSLLAALVLPAADQGSLGGTGSGLVTAPAAMGHLPQFVPTASGRNGRAGEVAFQTEAPSRTDAGLAGAVDLVLTDWDGSLVNGLFVDDLVRDRLG